MRVCSKLNLGISEAGLFTSRTPFLSSKQQYKSTEGKEEYK